MHYFMSDIHGNTNAYFALKEEVDISTEDKLYILGNIFDGNSEEPQQCLAILDDIMKEDNTFLILGKHEYLHLLYHTVTDVDAKKSLEKRISDLIPSGKPLLDYMKTLPKDEIDQYVSFLAECNKTFMVKIGKRYFYLVNGAPAFYKESQCGLDKWYEMITTDKIDLKRCYKEEIASDPSMLFDDEYRYEDTIIMCGNIEAYEAVETVPNVKTSYYSGEHKQYQRILFYDNKMVLNCGCGERTYYVPLDSTLACVSIDEKGYSVTYKYNINDM